MCGEQSTNWEKISGKHLHQYCRINKINLILFHISKPLLRTFATMRTSRPATGSFFSRFYIFAESLNMFLSRFCFFHNGRPADPFIASEWRESIPCISDFLISKNGLAHIIRKIMDDTGEKLYNIHSCFLL